MYCTGMVLSSTFCSVSFGTNVMAPLFYNKIGAVGTKYDDI
jgi:hypothetical protein